MAATCYMMLKLSVCLRSGISNESRNMKGKKENQLAEKRRKMIQNRKSEV